MPRYYTNIALPDELVKEIDKIIGKHGYRSRAELAKEAIRIHLRTIKG